MTVLVRSCVVAAVFSIIATSADASSIVYTDRDAFNAAPKRPHRTRRLTPNLTPKALDAGSCRWTRVDRMLSKSVYSVRSRPAVPPCR
jgi:hypothetical protein